MIPAEGPRAVLPEMSGAPSGGPPRVRWARTRTSSVDASVGLRGRIHSRVGGPTPG
jgi:hypothetical protein